MIPLYRRPGALLTAHTLPVATFATVILTGLAYRIRLYLGLLNADIKPFSFDPAEYSFFFTMQYLLYEILFAAAVTSIVIVVQILLLLVRNPVVRKWFARTLLIVWSLVLVIIALGYGAHYRLILEMNSGLELSLISEGMQGLNLTEFMSMLSATDLLFLVMPIGIFYFVYFQPAHWRQFTDVSLAVIAILAFLLPVSFSGHNKPLLARELRLNPIYFALSDILNSHDNQKSFSITQENLHRISSQLQSVQLIDPLFARSDASQPTLTSSNQLQPWNIVLIILESTGAGYIYNTSLGNEVPMPFLKKLAGQGLSLENHYSVGNSSPRAVFSIFSGTYETPTLNFFSLKRDLKIPALNAFFPEHLEQFLVTPCSTAWYFPKHYLEANGLKEIYGYHNVPVNPASPAPKDARNEIDTANFFLRRMEKAREPFFATYITFAPHYPYFDVGKDYHILPDLKNRLHRYYNALRLQDVLLERFYRSLEKKGQLERTILIIVGDHSEAFWQHPDNRIHSRYSFNENIRTPAIIWQPRLFKPTVLTEPTSHIDIAPTVLSAIGKPYNPKLFQGENLLNSDRRRRYIFAYGNENTLSIINRHNIKMQLLFNENSCRVFNLMTDPGENNPLSCSGYEEMRQAGMAFARLQPEIMKDFNRQYRLTGSFNGERHPLGSFAVR